MSDEAVVAYERSEAYEWTKRLGNQNAAIQSFQPFKVIYAMILVHLGLEANAGLVVKSIRQCSDAPPSEVKKSAGATISQLFEDRSTLSYILGELELKLGLRVVQQRSHRGESKMPSEEVKLESTASGPPKTDGKIKSTSADSTRVAQRKEGARKGIYTPGGVPPFHTGTAPAETEVAEESSFMTARSNLMDKTGYTITPEKSLQQGAGTLNSKDGFKNLKPGGGPSIPDYGFPGMSEKAQKPQQIPNNQAAKEEVQSKAVPLLLATPQEMKKKAQSPPKTAPPVMMGKKNEKPTPTKEAPKSSEKSGGSWSLGIKNWVVGKLNPDAHQVTLAEPEEKAYYDEKRKVWVFPGDNPDALVKPVGPPPTTPSAMKPEPTAQPATPSNDPLAAMMAPPSRAPSSLRRPGAVRGLSTPRSYPPGMPSPGMPSPAVGGAPPQFAVFKPKDEKK